MAALHLVTAQEVSPADLVDHYCELCDMRPLPWMRPKFAALLAEGFEGELLKEIILRTAMAPRPAWAYLEAIIRNCRRCGVYVLADFEHQRPKNHHQHQEDYY